MFDFAVSTSDTQAMTMASLIEVIRADGSLSEARRRNLACSIRRFCVLLDCSLEHTEAAFWVFRDRIKSFHPLAAGIKKRRWQTIRSDVAFALKHAGVPKHRPKPRIPYGPDWDALKTRLASEQLGWRLSRLAHFAEERGLSPQVVNDAVMADYAEFVRTQSFKIKPERHHRAVCTAWNKLVAKCPDLGLRTVTVHNNRETYTRPWAALPVAFRMDADQWLESLSQEADLLAEEGPIRPLRPSSINTYRYQIRQLAAGMEAKGGSYDTLESLSQMVEPATAKAALTFFIERNGGKTNSTIYGLAHLLVLIAETHAKAEPEVLSLLKRYRKRLVVRSFGMRPRPKTALRPFADIRNIEKILILPCKILKRLRRKSSWTIADARLMQVALALELLLMRPIRRKNLVDLRLDEHVIRAGGRTFIVIPADDVKNDYELDYPIPAESAALLDFYVKHLLPLFGPNPERFLFPGVIPGSPKSHEQFGRFFTKVIKEETGLHVYPHLMRHFGANLYLKENPGAFETVRRVLGHKSLTTTTRSYTNLDDEAAVRMFDQVILGIRDTIGREVRDD